MADVVHIGEKLSRLPKRPAEGPYEAKILFFTGVRYEKFSDDHEVKQQANTLRRTGGKGKKH